MARKSGTGGNIQPSIAETIQVFLTAMYTRLSMKNSGKRGSGYERQSKRNLQILY